MNRLRWVCVVFGWMLAAGAQAQSQLATDEQTLRSQNPPLPTDAKGLLKFFQDRSLKDGDAKHLEALVQKLGSNVYSIREPAKKALVARGPVALPFLRGALSNSPLEMKRRAELCISEIEAMMQSEPIAAAARVLAHHKEPKAAEALFNFLPSISTDPFLEEEILASVGRLTIRPDKVDPLLLDTLKDPLPFRRYQAAYLVARRSGVEHREQLRAMLLDKDPLVRQRIGEGLFGKRPAQVLQESLGADETLLRGQKIEPTEAALLQFFRKRTLNENDQKRFRALVKSMGHSSHTVREKATSELAKGGISALAFVKEAEYHPDVERSRRARMLLEEIRQSNNTAVPIAAAHLLARPAQKKDASPGESIRTLLAYVPFADDEAVEDEILTCLTLLSLREPKVEPELVKALKDVNPTRRAAAAFVLGHVGTKEQVAGVQRLLDDAQPVVRLRAAQGMLAARNKAALPGFVKLLQSLPAPYLPKVEEVLYRLAQDKGPTEAIQAASGDSRQKAVQAWEKWLDDNKTKIDLTSIGDRETYLGLITVCEYDNGANQIQGQVWEGTRGGPKRFTFNGVLGAMDAHTLPNGRILVAENSANRVTERDTKGVIKWEYLIPNNGGQSNPVCCQRLPNGNTFIASYNMVMEVTPARVEVYRISRFANNAQFHIFSAHKARNGHIVAITSQGMIIEIEAPSGKQINTVQTQTLGNWCSVELQPNGNYLVASMNPGTVREIDRKGTEVWSKNFPGVFRATKLPNGNVLVASMQQREVAEIDRSGTIRWRVTTQGRPWGVHYR
jgi:HEAT repeat protein